eukprot:6190679-Pleurochrysis_carterae.AAC.1
MPNMHEGSDGGNKHHRPMLQDAVCLSATQNRAAGSERELDVRKLPPHLAETCARLELGLVTQHSDAATRQERNRGDGKEQVLPQAWSDRKATTTAR